MSEVRQAASSGAGYDTVPLESPELSGYMPQGNHARRGFFNPGTVRREPRLAVPMREVVCYECGRSCSIPVAALSAACPHCFAHLNAMDVTVKPGTRHLDVRTLGDVKIPAGVELSRLRVSCRHLTLAGRVSGTLHSTGTLTMQGQAFADGQIEAVRLIVRERAHAQVQPGISCDEAELHGELTGCIHARGVVRIASGGKLLGECCSTELEIDPGGKHEGKFEVRGTKYEVRSGKAGEGCM